MINAQHTTEKSSKWKMTNRNIVKNKIKWLKVYKILYLKKHPKLYKMNKISVNYKEKLKVYKMK
jgi:hypothetical protein